MEKGTVPPRRRFWWQCLTGGLGLLGLAAPLVGGEVEIKMATIAPENAPYVKFLRDMGTAWEEATWGRVSLVVYSGGQAGDEPDIVRKMRIGQYQAAALTISGLYDIDEYFNVFQIPFFLDSFPEMLQVLEEVGPLLEERLAAKGFVHVAWGYLGWVHIFTREPVRTVEDLKRQKIFAWAGNDNMVQWYRRNGFRPVALSFPDIITGLQTGMIDAVPLPPLAAMQLGSFRQASHMLDLGFAPMIGGLIVNERTWQAIAVEDRERMLAAGKLLQERFLEQIPRLDETAVKMMGTQGLAISRVKGRNDDEWKVAAEAFVQDMGGGLVPEEIFQRAVKARDAYRRQRSVALEGDDRPTP